SLELRADADFADIFEVRGTSRPRRGRPLEPILGPNGITLGYVGLDGVTRRMRLECAPAPEHRRDGTLGFRFRLGARERGTVLVTCSCDVEPARPHPVTFERALESAAAALGAARAGDCGIRTSNTQ